MSDFRLRHYRDGCFVYRVHALGWPFLDCTSDRCATDGCGSAVHSHQQPKPLLRSTTSRQKPHQHSLYVRILLRWSRRFLPRHHRLGLPWVDGCLRGLASLRRTCWGGVFGGEAESCELDFFVRKISERRPCF